VIEKLEEVTNAYFSGRCDVLRPRVGAGFDPRLARAGRSDHLILAGSDLEGAARAGGAPW